MPRAGVVARQATIVRRLSALTPKAGLGLGFRVRVRVRGRARGRGRGRGRVRGGRLLSPRASQRDNSLPPLTLPFAIIASQRAHQRQG